MLFLERFGCKNKSAESSRESYCHWLLIAMQLGNFDRVSRESEAITSDEFTLFSVPHLHYQSSWNTSCVTSWNSSFAKVEILLSIQLEYQQLFHRLEFQPCHYGNFHPEFLDLCVHKPFSVLIYFAMISVCLLSWQGQEARSEQHGKIQPENAKRCLH